MNTMDDEIAIEVIGLSKNYPKPVESIGQNQLKGILPLFSSRQTDQFKALDNINFSIRKSEIIGVIGPNGSGKSTLLKIIAGITKPSAGKVIYKGRVASILDIGAGFHPELTGKENIFLRGKLSSLSGKEISARYDEIVSFSEIGDFVNTPVKNYSDGMFLRLAFSVAIHMNADILLLDEVLEVGDEAFKYKSFKKLKEIINSDITVMIVSHSIRSLQVLCDRIMVLENGKLLNIDVPNKIIEHYQMGQLKGVMKENVRSRLPIIYQPERTVDQQWIKLKQIGILKDNQNSIYRNQSFDFEILVEIDKDLEALVFVLHVFEISNNPVCSFKSQPFNIIDPESNVLRVLLHVPRNYLSNGIFKFRLNVGAKEELYLDYEPNLAFEIKAPEDVKGKKWEHMYTKVNPDVRWSLEYLPN